MNIFLSTWFKAINFLLIPNTILFFKILLGATIWRWIYRQFLIKHNSIFLLLLIVLLTWNFGIISMITILLIIGSSFLFAVKIFKIKDYLLASIVGLVSYVQIFTIIALISNVEFAYFTTLTIFCMLAILIKHKETIKISNFFEGFNVLDWTLIFIALIFGSLPQLHWDAVQANLYIAKWYVLSNSLAPVKESITSLFPQSAIVYYSLFFKAGGLKLLQMAFFLPFLLTIFLVKKITRQMNLSLLGQIILYLALATPIVLFQASNGYYDNLVLLLILATTYSLFYCHHRNIFLRCSLAAFLIGFAAGSKYFPLVMAPLPILIYLFSQTISSKIILPSLTLVVLIMTPLSLWLARSYVYTGSPVYPFFQQYFPTPGYWDASDRLESNFMIQTTMSVGEWVRGGVFTYPLKSYFHSTEFIEGTRGYPGFIYLAFLPIQIFFLIKSLLKLIKQRKISPQEQLFIYAFLAYFGVGLVVRYYRYLWPFQFLWLFSSLPLLQEFVANSSKVRNIITVIFLLITPLGCINLIDYYRYYPLDKTKVFQADYYILNNTDRTPMAYVNSHATASDLVLDASKFPVHRLHFTPRIYQCSWYWMGWAEDIKNSSTLESFRYLIANDPVTLSSNFCSEPVNQAVAQGEYELVYDDGTYTIYERN